MCLAKLAPTAAAAATTEVAPTAAASAATTATTATAAEVAARTFFPRTGFIDGQGAALKVFAVEFADDFVGVLLGGHFHEAKSTGLARELIEDQLAFGDVAHTLEQVEEVALSRCEG